MLRLAPHEQQRVDRKEDLRDQDRDRAADQRVDEALEREVRPGAVQGDDEHRRDRGLRARDRRGAGRGRQEQREAGRDDDLQRPAADDRDDDLTDDDSERDAREHPQRLAASQPRLGAERDQRGDRREERLVVPGNLPCELPCDAGRQRGLQQTADGGAVEAGGVTRREEVVECVPTPHHR